MTLTVTQNITELSLTVTQDNNVVTIQPTINIGGEGGGGTWGSITGTLSNQTDLQNALDAKGDVSKVGLTVNEQIGIWTGDGTLEGNSKLNFIGNSLNVGINNTEIGVLKVLGGNANNGGQLRFYNGATGNTNDTYYLQEASSGAYYLTGNLTGTFLTYYSNTGKLRFNGYGDGTKQGTPAHYLVIDSNGYIIELSKGINSNKTSTANPVSGALNIDWSLFSSWVFTLTEATTLTESNAPDLGENETITLYVTGDFALTIPVAWSNVIGAYDGTVLNQIVVEKSDTIYYVSISQPD